jgi:hypothetical protein
MVSTVSYSFVKMSRLLPISVSCLSPADDLDRPSTRRSHEHTDALLEGCTLKELWDDFGIVGDLIVSDLPFHSSPRSVP